MASEEGSRSFVCCSLPRCGAFKDLKACAACGSTVYCCKEHQVEHYKESGHKMVCTGRLKQLTFQECMEKATKYYTDQMYGAALPYYCCMLDLTERQVGRSHFQNGNLLQVIASCYKQQGKYEQAVQCLQKCLLNREANNDGSLEKNTSSLNTMGLIAEYYTLAGQLELAETLLIKMHEQAKILFGEQSFECGKILCSLSVCLESLNKIEEAEEALNKAVVLENYIHSTKPEDLLLASNAFYNLGVLQKKKEQYTAALENFQKCLEMRRSAELQADNEDIVNLEAHVAEILEKI